MKGTFRAPTMDFFGQQQRARRNTAILVLLLVVAVVLIIAAIHLAVVFVIYLFHFTSTHEFEQQTRWFQPPLLCAIAAISSTVILVGSLYKIWELRAGGEQVAAILGGHRISPSTTELDQRRVLNVVEEMAIAAGVAVPPVYLLEKEYGINAFAAGYTPDDAVIGISQGALDHLKRDELQGVVAHEFSHILNGDMRFNLRLIGILHGILVIGLIGYYILRLVGGSGQSSGRGRVGGVRLLLIGVALYIIGYVGLFFGRLIKAAVSRQREYLADASAVQFTRNAAGIGGALKKIGGLAEHSFLVVPRAEMASHMFFGSAQHHSRLSLFATHPPLLERVRAIDKDFDGEFPRIKPIVRCVPLVERAAPINRHLGLSATDESTHTGLDLAAKIPLDPAKVIAAVGVLTLDHVDYAASQLANLPDSVATALREPFSARCVVYAWLLDHHVEIRERQLREIAGHEGRRSQMETQRLARELAVVDHTQRLLLVDLAQGTLRQLSPDQYESFRRTVLALIDADQKVSLFEFVIQCVLLNHLDRSFAQSKRLPVRYYSIRGVVDQVAVLMSALARVGHRDAHVAQKAFEQAIMPLQFGRRRPTLQDPEHCSLASIQSVLKKLETCSMPVKKRIIGSATLCVAADGKVTVAEAELLRTLADSLDCPIPPIIPGRVKRLG